ncbi:MAG TPA: winged helix-turn-helix domain-containing protein [Gemmatimonadaceae bacterium]|nr:winged helix-turn-helix domain-containing protein [Gemmatimonadaceae bacterium]
MRSLAPLHEDRRFELITTDRMLPEWTALARRVSGTIVATDEDPLSALVYAVTAGLTGPMALLYPKHYGGDSRELRAAGAAACHTLPVMKKHLDSIADLFATSASLMRVDGRLHLLFDPIALTVRFRDQSVRLSQREFAVLQFMSSFEGQPVAAHKLLEYVWGSHRGGSRPRQILDVYIFQLRRKLERIGLRNAITTVRGVGYALAPTNSS